jgi:endoglucanase
MRSGSWLEFGSAPTRSLYTSHLHRESFNGKGAAVKKTALTTLVVLVATTAMLAGVPLTANAAEPVLGEELIPGGTFDSGVKPWFTTQDMVATNVNGELCVDVPGGTTTAWSSIIGVDNVPIVSGADYDFSFHASGTSATPVVIRALVQQPVSPWNATFEGNPAIGEANDYHFQFTSSLDLPDGQVVFQIGGAPEDWSMCIDNVSIAAGNPADAFVPETGSPVRANQVGYLTTGPKFATVFSDSAEPLDWSLQSADGATAVSGTTQPRGQDNRAGGSVHVIDFSSFATPGDGYTIVVDGDASYPFSIGNDIYASLRSDSLHYFSLVRSGIEITEPGYERAAGHVGIAPNTGDTAVGCQPAVDYMLNWTCDYTLDVSGGWYDAGDHGKYVVNGGIAVYQLMSEYERSLTAATAKAGALDDGTLRVPEGKNGVPDILDEARWELEWMLKMQVPAGKDLAGMAFHKVQDAKWTGLPMLPADDPEQRELHRPSTAATLNLAAVAAQGARLFEPYDPAFSAQLLEASRTAWAAAKATPKLYAPAADGNSGGGPYDDNDVSDEFYWAAAELYLSTGEAEFADEVTTNKWNTEDLFLFDGFSWQDTAALGRMDLATIDSDIPGRDEIRQSVVDLADRYVEGQGGTNWGMAYAPVSGYMWGSNSAVLNNLVVIATAYDISGDAKYQRSVLEGMDYLLGRNAMNYSYITGYGTAYAHNQHSRWFAHQLRDSLPQPPNGAISGGPNSDIQDPLAQQTFNRGCAAQQCYLDDIASYSTNEITVNWNSALSWVAAFVDDQTAAEVPAASASTPPVPLLIGGGVVVLGALGAGLVIARRRRSAPSA